MTAVDHAIVPDTSEFIHMVRCQKCEQQFNALAERWCNCDLATRTLVCPNCSTCFCKAAVPYKERFWQEAPIALRENSSRFRVGDNKVTPAMTAKVTAPAGSRIPRVLIVDDEEHMRSLVACYTEHMGYEATSVATPREALTLLEALSFDVVITDALMPEMDGRELSQQIKQLYGRDTKVVLMTSLYTANRYKSEARFRFGVDEYLSKPLSFDVLKAALDRVAPVPAA
jgi:CheY-like chemotaxis protein